MKVDIYNQSGEKTGSAVLPKEVFGLPWNPDLVHQVMLALQANKRRNTAHVKTRADVRGGCRKPWQQKGLGKARHGSIRSPIWRGGGVTFGPSKERVYAQKINKKMRRKALLIALSQKVRDGEILVLEDLKIKTPKTKESANILKALAKIKGFEKMTSKKGNASLFLLPEKREEIVRSFRNLPNTDIAAVSNLNLLDVLKYKYIVFPKDLIKKTETIWQS